MNLTAIIALFVAALTAADAATIPREHHARFLTEQTTLAEELAAWKVSPAGLYAKEHGLYKEAPSNQTAKESTSVESNDHLIRFFLSKVTAEKAQRENPEATYGTRSPFSLMTEEEFAKHVSKSLVQVKGKLFRGLADMSTEVAEIGDVAQDSSVDWTTSGCVAPVKDQGQCGSCWAFSSIGSLESAYCLKYGSLTQFSEQQVTDCDPQSSGCDGGWPAWALEHIQGNGGVCTETGYPFTSGDTGTTGTCSPSCDMQAITITSVASVTATDAGFASAISSQPVAVAVAAGNPSWKQYTGGVVSSCSTSALDHSVLAVGFDSNSFRFKNQWGTSWGADGFIQLKRTSSPSGTCSVINTHAIYPVIA
jgi:C1A family cysteine protease